MLSVWGYGGFSRVQLAAYYGAADVVAYLIELEADIDRVKPKSHFGWDVTGTSLL
jgi:hypothetical protein